MSTTIVPFVPPVVHEMTAGEHLAQHDRVVASMVTPPTVCGRCEDPIKPYVRNAPAGFWAHLDGVSCGCLVPEPLLVSSSDLDYVRLGATG